MGTKESYEIGRALGKAGPKLWLSILVVAFLLVLYVMPSDGKKPAAPAPTPAVAAQVSEAELCQTTRQDVLAEHSRLTLLGDHWGAATSLAKCAAHSGDLAALRHASMVSDRIKTINDKTESPLNRMQAINSLETLDAEKGAAFAGVYRELHLKQERETKARRRSQGVHIGMSQEDVLASNWGKPQSVNRTVTNSGVREQWVYGLRNYLYFRDGVLETVQTGN